MHSDARIVDRIFINYLGYPYLTNSEFSRHPFRRGHIISSIESEKLTYHIIPPYAGTP